MLLTNKFVRESREPDFASMADLVQSFTRFVLRQFPVILFATALMVAGGAVYFFAAPTNFTAKALMIIDTREPSPLQQQLTSVGSGDDSTYFDSQVETLKSENVALSVIKSLHLTKDPEFVGSRYGFIGALFDDGPKSEFDLMRRARETIANRLRVTRVGQTYVLEISFRSLNRNRAAQIANAIAEGYIADQLEAKYQIMSRAVDWLQDRISKVRDQASAAEQAVVEFKAKNNIVDSVGKHTSEQQVAELNSQLVVASTQSSDAQARLARIDEIIRADRPDSTVFDTLQDEVVSKLRSQYIELAIRAAEWSRRYGSNHVAVLDLQSKMRQIQISIHNELRRLAETFKSSYEIAKNREDGIQRRLAEAVTQSQNTKRADVALRDLESSAQSYRVMHDKLLQRYIDLAQRRSSPNTEARLITTATPPLTKSSPLWYVVFPISGFGGMLIGLGIATLRDAMDHVFRTATQVETVLQTGCIAVLPAVTGASKRLPAPDRVDRTTSVPASVAKAKGNAAAPRTIVRDQSPIWHATKAPLSRFSEAVRSIKMAVDLHGDGVAKPKKIIAVTSTLPEEGKSTVAAALAQIMVNSGSRVILVDLDLRNPNLSRLLAPSADLGILDIICARASIEEVIWTERGGVRR